MGRLSRAFLLFALGLPLSFPSLTYRFVSPASLVLPAAGFARHLGILSCWPLSSLPWRVYTHPRCSSPAGGFLLFLLLLLFPRPSPSYLPVVPGSEAPGVRAIRVRSSLPSESCRPGGTLFLSFFSPSIARSLCRPPLSSFSKVRGQVGRC